MRGPEEKCVQKRVHATVDELEKMQAFSNTAGLELLAMLQHAPPTARPQHAPPQQQPHHLPRQAAPPKPAQSTANAMPAVFPAPSDQDHGAGENSAGLHLMSLLGISGAGPTGAPSAQQQPQPKQAQQSHAQSDEPEEEQIVFGGFFAKQQAASRPPVVPAAVPSPVKKDNVAPSPALFRSRGQRPATGEVSTIRKVNARGPTVRLAKGPDGTIGFHAGRMAAGLPVVYIGTPSTRSTSPPSPRRSLDANEGMRGASAKKNNRKNEPFHRAPQHHAHRSPLKSCGNTGRNDGSHWRPTQPVFA